MDPLLFLNADTPWVYTLADRLTERHAVHAALFSDVLVYWRQDVSWPVDDPQSAMRRTMRVLPTGYAGRLSGLAAPVLRWMVDRWRADLWAEAGTEPWVVVCYPWAAPWVRHVPDDRLVYYNLDEYTLYRPDRVDRVRAQEGELVERAARTICLSQFQVKTLRDRHPAHANRIEHFPLGVRESFLNSHPEQPSEPNTVGYVGNLGARVDWALVAAVADHCPDLTFTFIGGPVEEAPTTDWERERARALNLPNVEHPGRVPQDEVPDYYQSWAVNWIPYDTEHPFNRASCPTKIMDGIASGRPVVSTSVPECTLYPEWIEIADDPGATAECLRTRAVSRAHDPERARRQVSAARKHTWERRARAFEASLGITEPAASEASPVQ
jgi:glycosyltransferase involved in cell wall biosynthesis